MHLSIPALCSGLHFQLTFSSMQIIQLTRAITMTLRRSARSCLPSSIYVGVRIYVYICMCVCVCGYARAVGWATSLMDFAFMYTRSRGAKAAARMDGWMDWRAVKRETSAARWQVSARVRRGFNAPRELSVARFAPEPVG